MLFLLQILAVTFFVSCCCCCCQAYRVSCYYRSDLKGLQLNNVTLQNVNCTDVIIGFVTVGDDYKLNLTSIKGLEHLKTTVANIKTSPGKRVMLSVGGGEGGNNFDTMAGKKANIATFVSSLVDVIKFTALDGVDYDWEFPTRFQRRNFALLLEATRLALDSLRSTTPDNDDQKLDLSVALPGPITLTSGYDTETLKATCTFFNVMTYDLILYNRFLPITSFHNALHGQGSILNPLRLFSVEVSMANWVKLGLPADMLLMGLPTYAVAYKLHNSKYNKLFSTVSGYSPLGANVNHNKVCKILEENSEHYHFDEQSKVPYVSDNEGNWFSYDDRQSIALKTEFAVANNYGGIMIFSLNADDPSGNCSGETFPLTKAATISLATAKNS